MSSSTERFHVAGVLVQAYPAQAGSVREQIGRVEGAVIHAEDAAGRLVVTLESADLAVLSHQLNTLQSMQGVVSAVLVSEHSEPLSGGSGAEHP
jgi:nitrate reductase NapD